MFKRAFIFSFVVINLLNAKIQSVELLADDVVRNGEITQANGNVVVYSQDYFATADTAKYNEANKTVELFGNVNLMQEKDNVSRASYVKLDLQNEQYEANETFMMNKEGEVWMRNTQSCTDEKYYMVKKATVSSCNVNDPDWHINFTSGKLNKESKFLHLFNPVFYIGDVPVLYLPYFGFPTDKTRRTGLLIPEFGYIKSDGGYYKQPIYFAPYESWDFQIDPQIRTRRGVGIYATFRFADSPYSYGEIRGGIFDNYKRHQERLEYKNEKHHGFEIEYDRSKLAKYLIDGDYKENLWIDFTKLNDLEYYDLIDKGGLDDSSENSLVTSRLNYYATTDNHYFGTYLRYYIDTAKLNKSNTFKNSDTVQELPTIQYHKFTNSLFLPNLIYSVDAKMHNYFRENGVKARQFEFDLPISISFPLLDDYLHFSFGESLYFTHIDWSSKFTYQNGEFAKDKSSDYANGYHKFSLFSDLSKPYENFFHTMSFKADLVLPHIQSGDIDDRLFKNYRYNFDKSNGKNISKSSLENLQNSYFYEDSFISELSDYFTHENINLGFTQFFYNSEGQKFLRHSIEQRYDFDEHEFSDLSNVIDLYIGKFTFGNRFDFNHKFDSFDRVRTYARYNGDVFNASLTHSYEYEKLSQDKSRYTKDNYLIVNASLQLPQNYQIFGRYEYDLMRDYSKMWRFGITHNRKCWNYSFVYQENIEPKNSSRYDYEKASKKHGFYFFVNFYPFGGVGYDFSVDKEYNGAN